ncbi:hypothetical protein ASG92_22235 [Arthrobacter sp. Soil736]|uniref:putative baseplate assembly protein n=1 Tax=Arthrobacter sp. Soil736 TaxID=1736395 RepID=UPI0006F5811B|nr:putative baseplate assembly protein [Arthrobacter sp. Soil736]KRE60005.1 hypothetical protein ASG92_22235 [Arthrobacter sp. Soil736]
MALISPILDDRSYQQLRDELVQRIASYTPEWTNHNESDPGIALLELFAYLGESTLYRFNQIPESTKVHFLRLLGLEPRPATCARTLVTASTDRPDGVTIPRHSQASAGKIVFETQSDLHVWPLDVVAVGKELASREAASKAERERRQDALARLGLDVDAASFYTSRVLSAESAASAVPLDPAATADRAVWIGVLRKPRTSLTALSGRSVFIGIAFDEKIDTPFALQDIDAGHAEVFRSHALAADPPPMLWSLWLPPRARDSKSAFTPLMVGSDTTRGLTTTGVIELQLPEKLIVPTPAEWADGGEDSPPPLNDDAMAAEVIAWIRVTRPRTARRNDSIGRIRWLGLNAAEVSHSRTAAPEFLGTGTGDPNQHFPLSQGPVLPGTVKLQVEEQSVWRDWTETDRAVAGTHDDRHFVLDYAEALVEFGGPRVPQIGERIRVQSYVHGGGTTGNVAAGAITTLAGGGAAKVTNPLPATGGADPASLAEALDAVPISVHRRDRAVTADDFRALALEVPGVVRAEPIPLMQPDTPAVEAAGVVSLVVFPASDTSTPAAPMPDLGLLRQVAAYLNPRRLLTTELYVIPPTYRKVAISVGLAVKPGFQVDAVRRWVELIVRQYLAPVPPYGPDGGGWAMGRAVRAAELEAVAVQVEGVEYLSGFRFAAVDDTGSAVPVDLLELEKWEVPEIVSLTVVAGEPLPPGGTYEPDPPESFPVPLPPEVC